MRRALFGVPNSDQRRDVTRTAGVRTGLRSACLTGTARNHPIQGEPINGGHGSFMLACASAVTSRHGTLALWRLSTRCDNRNHTCSACFLVQGTTAVYPVPNFCNVLYCAQSDLQIQCRYNPRITDFFVLYKIHLYNYDTIQDSPANHLQDSPVP